MLPFATPKRRRKSDHREHTPEAAHLVSGLPALSLMTQAALAGHEQEYLPLSRTAQGGARIRPASPLVARVSRRCWFALAALGDPQDLFPAMLFVQIPPSAMPFCLREPKPEFAPVSVPKLGKRLAHRRSW